MRPRGQGSSGKPRFLQIQTKQRLSVGKSITFHFPELRQLQPADPDHPEALQHCTLNAWIQSCCHTLSPAQYATRAGAVARSRYFPQCEGLERTCRSGYNDSVGIPYFHASYVVTTEWGDIIACRLRIQYLLVVYRMRHKPVLCPFGPHFTIQRSAVGLLPVTGAGCGVQCSPEC